MNGDVNGRLVHPRHAQDPTESASAVNRPTPGEKIVHAEWVAKAVRLSVKGWSFRRIAKHLGLHHSTVAEAMHAEFARVRPVAEEVETLRNIQREQIQRVLGTWLPKATGGDKDAALVAHKYLERAAKLDGLDAPTRNEHTGSDGAPIVITFGERFPDEQLHALAAADDSGDAPGVEAGSEGGTGEAGSER